MRVDVGIDLSDFEADCRSADTTLRFGTARAVLQAAREGLAEGKVRRRYKDRTGNLTGKAYARMLVFAGDRPEAVIAWPVPYASFVDGGTKAHEIKARRGKSLRLEGGSGAVTFARTVRHPGTRPDGFAGAAYLKAERVAVREVEVAIDAVQKIFSR